MVGMHMAVHHNERKIGDLTDRGPDIPRDDLAFAALFHDVGKCFVPTEILQKPDKLEQAAADEGFGIICFSPLAQGLLTDRYLDGIPADSRIGKGGPFLKREQLTQEKLGQIRALNEIARSRNQSLSQLALSWVLRAESVTSVLIGASSPEQIMQNLGILQAPAFTADELAKIDAITGVAY